MSNVALIVSVYTRILREFAAPLIIIGCTLVGIHVQRWLDQRKVVGPSTASHSPVRYAPSQPLVRTIKPPPLPPYDWQSDSASGLVGRGPSSANQPTKDS